MQSEDEDLEIPDETDEPEEAESGEIQPNENAVREKVRLLAAKKQIEAQLKKLPAVQVGSVVLPRHHCLRCGHIWIGRDPDNVPAQCPRCGIAGW
jgi:rubrerythrin